MAICHKKIILPGRISASDWITIILFFGKCNSNFYTELFRFFFTTQFLFHFLKSLIFDDNMAVWYNLMDYVFYYNLLKVCSINGQSF